MREEGVEPSHLSVLEPKSSASASSATPAANEFRILSPVLAATVGLLVDSIDFVFGWKQVTAPFIDRIHL